MSQSEAPAVSEASSSETEAAPPPAPPPPPPPAIVERRPPPPPPPAATPPPAPAEETPVETSGEPPEGEEESEPYGTQETRAPVLMAEAPKGEPDTPADDEGEDSQSLDGDPDQLSSYPKSSIDAMRARSKSFRRMHDRLKECTERADRKVDEHSRLRTRIDALEGQEKTSANERELEKLRAKARRLEATVSEAYRKCTTMEVRLARLLHSKLG